MDRDLYPSLERCNEFLDWVEDHNVIDLNDVRLRIREVEEDSGDFVITVEWFGRSKENKPSAFELRPAKGWVMQKWEWTGIIWASGFWWAGERKLR